MLPPNCNAIPEKVLCWMKFTLKGITTRPFVVEIDELEAVF